MARKPAAGVRKTAASARPKRAQKKAPAKAAAPAAKKAIVRRPKLNAAGRKTKPTWAKMILRSLILLRGGKRIVLGVSGAAIGNYIAANYPVKPNYRRFLRAALKKLLADGLIAHVNLNYRLTPKGRSRLQRKTGKRRKSPAAKKAGEAKPGRAKAAGPARKKASKAQRGAGAKKGAAAAGAGKKRKAPAKARGEKPAKKAVGAGKRVAKKPRGGAAAAASNGSSGVGNIDAVSVSGSKFDHLWQYKTDGGNWGQYDVNASDVLEDVYQKYLQNRGDTDVRAVKSGSWEYQVDFLAMKQTNIQHPNHTVRDIRRVPIAK